LTFFVASISQFLDGICVIVVRTINININMTTYGTVTEPRRHVPRAGTENETLNDESVRFLVQECKTMEAEDIKEVVHKVIAMEHHAEKQSWRNRLLEFLESPHVQMALIFLVLVDLFAVVLDLLMDFEVLEESESASHFLFILSMTILSIFLLELLLLAVAMGKRFFKTMGFVFDLAIVTVSIITEALFFKNKDLALIQLIIIFRLWRVVRIFHAMIVAAESSRSAILAHYRHKSNALYVLLLSSIENRKFLQLVLGHEREARRVLEDQLRQLGVQPQSVADHTCFRRNSFSGFPSALFEDLERNRQQHPDRSYVNEVLRKLRIWAVNDLSRLSSAKRMSSSADEEMGAV
jgi:hypothetical protein